MTQIAIGQKAPDFTLPTDGNGSVTLSKLAGQKVLIYFYPKDNTPGCTTQACDLNDNLTALNKLNLRVIGISKDSVQSHDKFKAKYSLNFTLASDENSDICEQFGVWVEKSMYGKKYMGIERSSFLIDENGVIEAIWNKVSPKEHLSLVKTHLETARKAA
ncbi:MAG: thioredoxin-dependent thiol peroxidase [Alphaproteobacteria bacterium]